MTTESTWACVDGNEAAASVAHRLSEVVAIYPITPASPMGELADTWSAQGRPNLWGQVPEVVEMQSEAGAAGTVHGALLKGALATTFTASQGLLLMLPNMFKIAGELTPAVFHVAARALATHALSIFGDHSDVMAARTTGWAMLASASVQEAHDLALVAHAATLTSRIPFVHFFDGFRTSHEVNRIELLDDADLRALVDEEDIRAHRDRGLSPDRPQLRGSAQNPDVFFQAREAANRFHAAVPGIVQERMDRLASRTGRAYRLVEYEGAPDAEQVLVVMGSAAGAASEAVAAMRAAGERVGLVTVRLYRPFPAAELAAVLPPTVRRVAVLDRTKEPGAPGEPLYLDVVAALAQHGLGVRARPVGVPARQEAHGDHVRGLVTNSSAVPADAGPAAEVGAAPGSEPDPEPGLNSGPGPGGVPGRPPLVVGGRYGLASKEFTPAMAKGTLDALGAGTLVHGFTVGITDDVTHTSVLPDPDLSTEDPAGIRAVFYGLGSDGTVGANKTSVKIIGEHTGRYAQGYFVYDSKKAGSVTVSHLRVSSRPIRSTYLVDQATFVACHQFGFLERMDVLGRAGPGATFLLNSPWPADEVWSRLPAEVQEQIVAKHLDVWVVDAARVAREAGMGRRINTVMQPCFFALAGVLPREQAVGAIRQWVARAFASRGDELVRRNFAAIDAALDSLAQVRVPGPGPMVGAGGLRRRPAVPEHAPEFVQRVTARMLAGEGDLLPVSALPVDGAFPTGTARWEKRALAEEIPTWDPSICIDCAKCAIACPHAAIRIKVFEPGELDDAPEGFLAKPLRGREVPGAMLTVQVAPDDCTGCGVCVQVCPAHDRSEVKRRSINMTPVGALLAGATVDGAVPAAPAGGVGVEVPAAGSAGVEVPAAGGAGAGTGGTGGTGVEVPVAGGAGVDAPVSGGADAGDVAAARTVADRERANWEFFLGIDEVDRTRLSPTTVQGSQARQPLMEFSGACGGCGETPYLKLVSQLFGDRLLVANATGCSSIYGGNLPTTPWTVGRDGRGPAWANSLFEENAEFGLGFRLAADRLRARACQLVGRLAVHIDDAGPSPADEPLSARLLAGADPAAAARDDAGVQAQRERVAELRRRLARVADGGPGARDARELEGIADELVRRSVWIVGGDGWAYDIGSGGLDHVLASGADVNVLVLDTEVYSNTGGQASKATPRGAVAKFAARGKQSGKKDLGLIAMSYGNVYVAHVALGGGDRQTVSALLEAEAWPGPSLVLAYSTCVAHGFDMTRSMEHQRAAVRSGHWPLYRYNPAAERPFHLDSRPPTVPLAEFAGSEARFAMLARTDPASFDQLMRLGQEDVHARWNYYEELAALQRVAPKLPPAPGAPVKEDE